MVCEVVKIDSNITGLAIAEEVCLKQLPTTAVDGFEPTWFGQEPNSYSDFGGEVTTVARSPIDPNRQNKKGTVTDLDASGGFNTDFTQNNLTRILQGFFFADARVKPSTLSLALGTANTAITSVDSATKTYAAASGLLPFNKAGYLVKASGFANASNNGVKTVVSATAGTVVVSEAVINEAAPPAAAKLETVGFQFPADDVAIAVTSGIPAIVAFTIDLTTLGLVPGEWIWLGGDAVGSTFVNNKGFARVSSISQSTITFDDTTWTPVNEAATGITLRMFFGTVIKNERGSLIKRRSYNIERTLGEGPEAENPGDQQAEYLEGAVCNELTLNIPQAEKFNADLTFVACDNTHRSGAAGDKLKAGTRVAGLGEDAFNTSSDVYRIKMAILDPTTSRPSPLFGYVTEATLTIQNGVTPNKAVGTLGAIDTSAANFVAGGSATAYFNSVAASRAIRNNADVGFSTIMASRNAGMVFDIPLLGLGGGRNNVEKDAPITVPLETNGAENVYGYTAMYVNFPYLPNAAMPG